MYKSLWPVAIAYVKLTDDDSVHDADFDYQTEVQLEVQQRRPRWSWRCSSDVDAVRRLTAKTEKSL